MKAFHRMLLQFVAAILLCWVHVAVVRAQGECLNCLNGKCSLDGQCECNAGFERKNNDCKALSDGPSDDESSSAELLPGLPNAILFGLIAGGVLLLLIMLACCFYFIRSSFSSDAGLSTAASYRDNAVMAARANTVAGQSAAFNSPANSGVFAPNNNANSGVFFGGGGGGGGFPMNNFAQPQQLQPMSFASATPTNNTQRTVTKQKSMVEDIERDSVHRGYAFPGSMAASNVHEPELDLPNDDGEFDVDTDELVPEDVGGLYTNNPVVSKPPAKKKVKKPQFVCDECGAEYYWETDLTAHQRKRH